MDPSKVLKITEYIRGKVLLDKIKAMKLPYIAFGFYGAMHDGKHLFENRIEAWDYGPVIPDLYHAMGTSVLNPCSLTPEETKTIDFILKIYGRKPSFNLVDLTHKRGTPWSEHYKEGENNEISKEEIIEYYKNIVDTSQLMLKLAPVFEDLAKT